MHTKSDMPNGEQPAQTAVNSELAHFHSVSRNYFAPIYSQKPIILISLQIIPE